MYNNNYNVSIIVPHEIQRKPNSPTAQILNGKYHKNRQILWQVMTKAGFRRHPQEWWHFSYGDQLWAWLENQSNLEKNTIAIYGNANVMMESLSYSTN